MKKSIIIPLLTMLFTAGCTAQINQAKTEKSTREIKIDKKFTGISSSERVEIIYTQNDSSSQALITGEKDIVDNVTYEVKSDGILSFKLPKKYKKKKSYKITVQLNGGALTSYQASSSGTISVTTPVKTNSDINCSSSSGGKIVFDKKVLAQGSNINASSSSAGIIEFTSKVKCNNIYLSSSSSGKIKIANSKVESIESLESSLEDIEETTLSTGDIYVSISSGASVKINKIQGTMIHISASSAASFICKSITAKSVSAVASSGANITIEGSCDTGSMNASSGSDINAKYLKIKKSSSISSSSGGKVSLENSKKN